MSETATRAGFEVAGRLAVVTGGATGIGRALVHALARAGASVAACDWNHEGVAATCASAAAEATGLLTAHPCDVRDPESVERFGREVLERHDAECVHLVINNAGIAGADSFLESTAEEWERVFDVNWGGVYNTCRTFLPLLVRSSAGRLVNISSVNGLWAVGADGAPLTAYATAKYAVKGFTESLIADLRINAPHVQVMLVLPGHVGTDIVANAVRYTYGGDDDIAEEIGAAFRDSAPVTADAAADEILRALGAGDWRVLIGDDARHLDGAARSNPVEAYDLDTVFGPTEAGQAC